LGCLFYCRYLIVSAMEGKSIFRTMRLPLSHLPTVLLIVGYPIYWLELYAFRAGRGNTTPLAWIIFCIFALIVLYRNYTRLVAGARDFCVRFSQEPLSLRLLLVVAGIGAGVISLCAFYAALLPPHLVQESDLLNYHLTLPRQHLIMHSFKHIPWSTADLYLLPIDFSLAPYWLATNLPNKFPQFLFFAGIIPVSFNLVRRFSGNNFLSLCLIVLAVFGSHSVGIQAGTAMLDLALCYLFLAALDSFLGGAILISALEFVFLFWSKSFIPLQLGLTFMALFCLMFVLKKWFMYKVDWNLGREIEAGTLNKKKLQQFAVLFLICSIFIAGPFIAKSMYYAGTPLFPFKVGILNPGNGLDRNSPQWQSLLEKSKQCVTTRDDYGAGRSLKEFIGHFWLIAVPEEGVNNRYDYPVGLMYLLFVGPFLYVFISSLRKKKIGLLPFFVVVYWLVWWVGSQQTRFLFIPILLMFISVIATNKFQSRILIIAMLIALFLTGLSVFRAHRADFGCASWEVLRPKDRELIAMSKTVNRNQPVKLNYPDVAFADFEVDVQDTNSVFVLQH